MCRGGSPPRRRNELDVVIGEGGFRYRVDEHWAEADAGARGELAAVACDRHGRVYLCSRDPQPKVLVYDTDGHRVGGWGEDTFHDVGGIHSITIAPDDTAYVTDVLTHAVYQLTLDGELLRTLGTPGRTGPPGQPFNSPTKAVATPDGEVFVADGYGQARVHRFAASGELLLSWGEPGREPGQFDTPHSIGVDRRGTVWVADRENGRVQMFDTDGRFLDQRPLERANNITFDDEGHVYVGADILDLGGNILAHSADYGGHCVACDAAGDLYWTHVGAPNQLKKLVRLRD